MWLSLLPHVLQPATLPDAGACGVGLRKHAARSADLRCARARQAYGSRPAPRVVHARTRRKTCVVPVVARTQSERNPAQARGCCSRGFGESTWRRWRARTPARSNRPARSCPCDTMPLQKPARARPLAQGHPFWPSAGEPSLLGYRTEAAAALGRRPKVADSTAFGRPGTRSGSMCLPSQPSSRRGGWLSCARATTPQ